jgi:hypothetical protein
MPQFLELFLVWLEESAFAVMIRQSLWLYPFVQFVHIAGIVILAGPVIVIDLRVLGIAQKLSLRELNRSIIPWARGGFVIAVLSGITLFSAHATDWGGHPVFRIKMVLILLAVLNAEIFTRYILKRIPNETTNHTLPRLARIPAIISLLFWFSVIAAGRFLAYY